MVSLFVCCLLGASQLLPEQGGLLACGRWQVCLSLVAVSAVWWFGKEEQRNLSFLVVSFQSDRLKHRHPTQTCPPWSLFSCGSAVVLAGGLGRRSNGRHSIVHGSWVTRGLGKRDQEQKDGVLLLSSVFVQSHLLQVLLLQLGYEGGGYWSPC